MAENFQINIVMSCDQKQFLGLITTINSILKSTKNPIKMFFYILVPESEYEIFYKIM